MSSHAAGAARPEPWINGIRLIDCRPGGPDLAGDAEHLGPQLLRIVDPTPSAVAADACRRRLQGDAYRTCNAMAVRTLTTTLTGHAMQWRSACRLGVWCGRESSDRLAMHVPRALLGIWSGLAKTMTASLRESGLRDWGYSERKRFWTLVPMPILWVLPISVRTEPCLTFSMGARFLTSDSASPTPAICARGMQEPLYNCRAGRILKIRETVHL
jgi:hypothetical protein